MSYFIFPIFLVITMAGCLSPNSEATITPTQVMRTARPTKQPQPTQTYTPSPTRTISSPTPSATPTPKPTLTAFYTPLVGFHKSQTLYYPNHEWVVESYFGENIGNGSDSYTRIYNTSRNLEWIIHFDVTKENWLEAHYSPYYWTEDGNYLYLLLLFHVDFIHIYYTDWSGFYKLNLNNGDFIEILPSKHVYAFSISPDETKLAYIRSGLDPVRLTILDLVSGEERHIPLDAIYTSGGSIVWSPDGNELIFSTTDHFLHVFFVLKASISTLSYTPVAENLDQLLMPIEWIEDDLVILKDTSGNFWQLNVQSNGLSIATKTPYP